MRNKLLAAVVAAVLGTAGAAHADDSTTIGGKMYADFTMLNTTSDGVDKDPRGFGIDVKRFYVGVDHKFDDTYSANITTDFNYVGGDGETQVFVKKAYLQAKLGDGMTLRLGSADMPWIPYVEGVYGLRYVENTLVDRTKFANSADWGVHLLGKSDSGFNYQLSVVNGGGYKNPSRSKGMDLEARLGYDAGNGFAFAVGGYSGKRGKDTETTPAVNTASRFNLLAAYKGDGFSAGIEYFTAKAWNDVLSATTDKSNGYSLFGRFDVSEGDSIFARVDNTKPRKDTASSLKETYFNVGYAHKLSKKVDLALVYKNTKVENGTFNGIGGVTDGKQSEFGVWTQVAF